MTLNRPFLVSAIKIAGLALSALNANPGLAQSDEITGPSFEGGFDIAEYRLLQGSVHQAWESEFSWGVQLNRAVVQFNGGGMLNHRIGEIEGQLLYEHLLGETLSLRAGARYFMRPHPHRTSAVLALGASPIPGLGLEGIAYMSETGDLTGEVNFRYEYALTPALMADARLETSWAAQGVPEEETGSGFGAAEMSLRLRYTAGDHFKPYVGILHAQTLSKSQEIAQQAGEETNSTQFLLGLSIAF